MDFDERQLRAFVAISETGSLGRAARIVHLTQPSVSRLVQAMEARLGHPLFERTTRGMALSAAGELLLPRARHLLFEFEAAREELDSLKGLRKGTVRIGAVGVVVREVIAHALHELRSAYPALRAQVTESSDDDLVDALRQRIVDLAIVTTRFRGEDIEYIGTCRFSDRYAVFAAFHHPLREQPSLDAVGKASWVMPGIGTSPRRRLERAFERLELGTLHVAVEADSPDAMLSIAARTDLLCWLPQPMAQFYIDRAMICELDVPAFAGKRTFHLYRRRSGLLPEAARRMLDHIPMDGPN